MATWRRFLQMRKRDGLVSSFTIGYLSNNGRWGLALTNGIKDSFD